MIDAVREMNKASGLLVETTNKLTTRILWLTVAAIFFGLVQAASAVISLFSSR